MKKFFEKHDLFKFVSIAIIVTILFTWFIKSPDMMNGAITGETIKRTGIVDVFSSGVYGINFFLQQMLLVLAIGVFYGILSKVSGYQNLVKKIAEKLKGKERIFVIFTSFLVALLASILTQTFVVLIFIPFIIHLASKLKLDKITTMLCSFGSILVGVLGATLGTEGVTYFLSYLGMYGADITIKTMLGMRFGLLALALIVYNFLILLRLKKIKNNTEAVEEVFLLEEKNKNNAKIWPMVLFFVILFLFMILGYVNWVDNFNVTIFDDFHTWLTGLAVGEHNILSYIIGSKAVSFGNWDLYMIMTIMGIILLFTKIIYRVNLDDLLDQIVEGIKAVIKPCLIMFLLFTVFVFVYWSPFTYTISKGLLGNNFNPFLTAIAGFITGLFHLDFGYTAYLLGEIFTTTLSSSLDVLFVIYVAMHGFAGIIAPTSILLFLGLSYLNIPYKEWLKNIWKFALAMLVILMGLFALLTYL